MAGLPQKIPTNPKNIGKMAKNAPTVQSENAPKRVKMAKITKNWQKWPKNGKKCIKIAFLYNNFPEKVISLRKCTNFFFAFSEKKYKKKIAPAARILVMCGDPPPAGGGTKKKFLHTATQPHILIPQPVRVPSDLFWAQWQIIFF